MLHHPPIKEPVAVSADFEYVHHGLCFLRVPFFPVHYLSRLHAIDGAGPEEDNLFTDPAFLEALFLGSRDLYGQYQKYLHGARFSERITRKLFGGIERYFIRMCSRCTPYGLFAGYKIGCTGEATRVSLGAATDYRRHIHLDMHALTRLARHIQALPRVRPVIRYFPNSSLYSAGDKLRYVETFATDVAGNYRISEGKYRISAVNASPYIEAILNRAETGGLVAELAACITDEEITPEEAGAFVDTLIDNQLLVSELEPAPSGGDVFGALLSALSFLPPEDPLMERLRAVERLLKAPLPGVAPYERIADLLGELLPDVSPVHLTYTDLERTGGEAVIGERVILDIQNTIGNLWPIFLLQGNEYLRHWKEAFTEKFDNEEIPLVIALDPELGIGYRDHADNTLTETPLLDELGLEENAAAEEIRWSRLLKWKNKKLKEALLKREAIVITDEDIKKVGFYDVGLELPENVYTMGSILAASGEEADRGNYLFSLDTCFGPGSASLLSRFANDDVAFALKLRECAGREEAGQPEKIFAEIVHLPEARGANMALRPPLRAYEIAYLARPAVGAEYQIPVSDLLVSCVGGKVILRSRRLNKEIVPRLTASHNYMSTDLPIYKFLCDLQMQDSNASVIWDWEVFKDDPYLPRVIYKNILLCPAAWNIDYDDLGLLNEPGLQGAVVGREELFAAYGRIRRELGMPARVVIASHDQKLFIDLEDEAYLRLFHQHFQKNRRLRLQEFLFDPGNCLVTGEEGKYAHELIIPFSRNKGVTDLRARQGGAQGERRAGSEVVDRAGSEVVDRAGSEVVRREFAPGSEWLYLKLYSGRAVAERLVRESLGPLAAEFRLEGSITKWFFIRYADPKPHLRMRFFHPTDASFWQRVMEKIHGMMAAGAFGEGAKLQYDTYERELSRYGDRRIGLSETLFYHDSEAVVRIAGLLEGDGGETLRWLIALRNIDSLLTDFRLDLVGRHRLTEALKNDFLLEFKVGKEGMSQLDQLYRNHARRIAGILDEGQDEENGMGGAAAILGDRSARNKPIIQELLPMGGEGYPAFIASHVHMAMNRLLVTDHRKQELALYYLLWRAYASRLGFVKHNTYGDRRKNIPD
jgi:thiopeptide-type bacteriocin biosynthesis protein